MAEETEKSADASSTAGTDDKVKAAAEGLKKILDVLAPEVKTDEKPGSPRQVIDEIYGGISAEGITDVATQARTAAERYRNSMRWMVGAVAAIGLILFGSTVFTDGNALDSWSGRAALLVAAIGLALILFAATMVFEPEDASLGELADDIDLAQAKLLDGTRPAWWGWKLRLSPRLGAVLRLSKILEGDDASAHLGHPHRTVRALIKSIGDGQGATRSLAAKDVATVRRTIVVLDAKRLMVSTELEQLLETRASLDKDEQAFGGKLDPQIETLLDVAQELRRASARALNNLVTAQTTLFDTDHQLGMDLLHRDLVLSESGVAQLRGSFRLSRTYLLIGAVLALFGSMFYLSSNEDSEGTETQVRAGTLRVATGTPTADEFPRRVSRKAPLSGVLR